MRLDDNERDTIVKALLRHFADTRRILLFGSRTDDARRGGDIDLLVECGEGAATAVIHRADALTDIQFALGERKIDLVVAKPEGDNRAIVRQARETGIPIWTIQEP